MEPQDHRQTMINSADTDVQSYSRPPGGSRARLIANASALDGANRVYSNPKSITYGPHIIEFDLDGAGNREELAIQAESAPDTDTDLATMAYTKGGVTPAVLRHSCLVRFERQVQMSAIDHGNGVSIGGLFADVLAGVLDVSRYHEVF